MFKKAQTKLTIYYSVLFLFLFWTFSSGLYVWMNNSFGEGYISNVEHRQGRDDRDEIMKNSKVVTIAGDVAMDQLRDTLIVLNIGLLFVIPLISSFLAKKTLTPVREAHEKQKQFVSDASHEMRTPLAIMSGEIDVTLSKKRTTNEYQKTLISTREETKRLSNLVENLLFLAKDDQQTSQLSVQSVDITDLINEVKQSLQIKSGKKKIAISLQVDEVTDSPMISGHQVLLRQLFYNLLDNAITYTPTNGKITISLSELKNTIIISITDTGVGIAKEKLAKITRRFYRVDSSRSETKGYGLGLAIVKSILKRHHGKLLIQSEENKGSTFTVILPKT
ncbi:MAG: sensor histidine kinase [Candidatus Levyibacteriota bacterium]